MNHKILISCMISALAIGLAACDSDDDKGAKTTTTCSPRCSEAGEAISCDANGEEVINKCDNGCDSTTNTCKESEVATCSHTGDKCLDGSIVTCVNGTVTKTVSCGTLGCDASTNTCIQATCNAGELQCANNKLQKCENNAWVDQETCEFGCSNKACNQDPDKSTKEGDSCDVETYIESCNENTIYYCNGEEVTAIDCESDTCALSKDNMAFCYSGSCTADRIGCETVTSDGESANFATYYQCEALADGTQAARMVSYAQCDGSCTESVGCEGGTYTKGGKAGESCFPDIYTDSCSSENAVLSCDTYTYSVESLTCESDSPCAVSADGYADCATSCQQGDADIKVCSSFYSVTQSCMATSDGKYAYFMSDYEVCDNHCKDGACVDKILDKEGESCDSSSYADTCTGDILSYCYEGTVYATNCAAYNAPCRLAGGYGDCFDKSSECTTVGEKQTACQTSYFGDYFVEYECKAEDGNTGKNLLVPVNEAYCNNACNTEGTDCDEKGREE